MRLTVTVVDPAVAERRDVVLEADAGTPLRSVVRALAGTVRDLPPEHGPDGAPAHSRVVSMAARRSARVPADAGRAGALVVDEAPGEMAAFVQGQRLDLDAPLAGSPVRDGAVVSLDDASGCVVPEPVGSIDLRVTSGPGSGVVHRLGAGEWTIGAGPACGIVLDDPDVGQVAATLVVDVEGSCRLQAHDGAVVELERAALEGEQEWLPGQQLRLATVLLEVSLPTPADAALSPSEDGSGLDYNRPPRMLPAPRKTTFRLPKEPAPPSKRGLPLVMMLAPMAMCVPLAFIFGNWYYLLLGLLSPVTLLGNYVYERRNGKRVYLQDMASWRELTALIEAEAHEALERERVDRRAQCPDPGAMLLVATGPRARLWERRRHDPDHLVLRFGTADLPSEVKLEDPAQLDHKRVVTWQARDVPVAVAWREAGVVGIAGSGDLPRRLASWAVAQLAVLQSPRDVQVWLLTDGRARAHWEWVRWLPHLRPGEGHDVSLLLGTDTDSLARRVGELGAILAARQAATRQAGQSGATLKDPDLLVVLDGARRLRSLPGVIALLKEGPAVGILALCLDADERLLPEECDAVVVEAPGGTLRVSRQLSDVVEDVRPDLVSADWCERLARSLAPVRDVSDTDEDSALPSSSRLLDVIKLEPPTADAVAARWALEGRTTRAVVGESLDGPFAIDLRRDGPHGLVAGTTGSGKSELLQTIVASLAVANRPDAMTFVLVDYKGGSAFKDCVRLPHTVGMVTDLDTHLVGRALESLSAELRRREHLLAAAGAKDIEDYTDLLERDGGLEPMPRLLIVIDEFASMARELPDFVTGLVNVAQRGRSLGIHLILATQRPSGVVSPEIRANTNLRIALRVTDAAESSDVIEAPDAARIAKSTPGRAYVRLGHTWLVPFQTGRVGGRRPGARTSAPQAVWVRGLAWDQLAQGAPRPPREQVQDQADDTDLAALVEAVRGASEAMGLAAQHSPWLPALPEVLLVGDLPAAGEPPTGGLPAVAWALEDIPSEQARRPALIDLDTFGHQFVVGGPRSGRSQALRTIAFALAQGHSSADVHLFGLDCGNGALLALAGLPHCGAVVQRTQTERAQRLLTRLAAEVARRQEVLADGGWADVTEQRGAVADADRLSHVVLLLDRWEGFLGSLGEIDAGALTDVIMNLLREGASAGVHVVVAGDRQLLSGRVSTLTEDKLVMRLPDRTDFSLAGINPRTVPDEIAAGRGFRAESAIETQVALLDADPAGAAQAAAIERLAERVGERDRLVPRSMRPFRVDVLPARLTFEDAWRMRADPDAPVAPLWAMVGVGGDELATRGADLAGHAATFVVAGPAKSGRSTVLLTMARSLLAGGTELVVVTPRMSPLRELEGRAGVRASLALDDLTQDQLEPLLGGPGPVALLVDDAELLRDCSAKDYLRDVVRTAQDRSRAVVVAGNIADVCGGFTGWQVDIRKNRHGVLLNPQQITDGDLVGVRLTRSSVGGPASPGRAMLHDGGGELVTVQVPLTTARWGADGTRPANP